MAWTEEEDEQLRKLVAEFGPKKWVFVASKMENKGGKQCRRRWQNYLNCDNNKQGGWSPEEDEVLMREHKIVGNKWTEIAKAVGGRTDNAVKNRYAALMTKQSGGTASGGVKKKKPPTTTMPTTMTVVRLTRTVRAPLSGRPIPWRCTAQANVDRSGDLWTTDCSLNSARPRRKHRREKALPS